MGLGENVSQTYLCLPKCSHSKNKGHIPFKPVPILGMEDLVSQAFNELVILQIT